LRTCFVCGKRGHIASQCFHRKGVDERNNENNKVNTTLDTLLLYFLLRNRNNNILKIMDMNWMEKMI
jgi:hypothetical protein